MVGFEYWAREFPLKRVCGTVKYVVETVNICNKYCALDWVIRQVFDM